MKEVWVRCLLGSSAVGMVTVTACMLWCVELRDGSDHLGNIDVSGIGAETGLTPSIVWRYPRRKNSLAFWSAHVVLFVETSQVGSDLAFLFRYTLFCKVLYRKENYREEEQDFMANVQREPNGEPRLFTKLVIIKKPQLETEGYQRFLSTLQSHSDGYWKWKRHPRIREVFVVTDITNPEAGQVHKCRIKRKVQNLIDLENCAASFDVMTGRSFPGEGKYLFPLEDMRVWSAWEPQSLRRRIERAVPNLSFKSVQDYSDLLDPAWRQMFEDLGLGGSFERFTNRSAASLSEFEQRSMVGDRESAKRRMLAHLPTTVVELKVLAEMMEGDAKC